MAHAETSICALARAWPVLGRALSLASMSSVRLCCCTGSSVMHCPPEYCSDVLPVMRGTGRDCACQPCSICAVACGLASCTAIETLERATRCAGHLACCACQPCSTGCASWSVRWAHGPVHRGADSHSSVQFSDLPVCLDERAYSSSLTREALEPQEALACLDMGARLACVREGIALALLALARQRLALPIHAHCAQYMDVWDTGRQAPVPAVSRHLPL